MTAPKSVDPPKPQPPQNVKTEAVKTPAAKTQAAKKATKTAAETAAIPQSSGQSEAPRKQPAETPAADGKGAVIPAAYRPGSAVASPLGLRYSILKKVDDATVEVDPNTTFHSGDRIKLRVGVNDTGYLYIVHRGSSGVWKPLFPSPEIAGGVNRVTKDVVYDLPSGYVFTFDEQAGKEQLFVVLSRQPEADLEQLIYGLRRDGTKPANPANEVKPPTAGSEPKTLMVQNIASIDDRLVSRLRTTYSRDLIIEKVDEQAPGPRKEKAVYAVSPAGGKDARVVVDVTLNHQ